MRESEGDLMLVYCDSMIFIYFLDMKSPFNARTAARMAALWSGGGLAVFTDLSRLECRITPLQRGATKALTDIDGLFTRPDVRFIPITTAVFDRAALIRAAHNFKLGDSLHLAAAMEAGCDHFLTNDLRLSAFTGVPIEVLP
jgi:uncharacterized protein